MRVEATPPVRIQPFRPPVHLERTAKESTRTDEASSPDERAKQDGGSSELTREESREVQQLRQRDLEVKAHEQAHKAAGGRHAGAPQYEYQTGADGARYAVAGEVSIDSSPVAGDPAATVRKMQTVRKAALAPQSPSAQDLRVASKASAAEAQASRELQEQQREEAQGADDAPPRTFAQRAYEENAPTLSPGILFDAVG